MGRLRHYAQDTLRKGHNLQEPLHAVRWRFSALGYGTFVRTLINILCFQFNTLHRLIVGNALRRNPFAPFVPCHRIVSSDLKLGGFYGEWGTEGHEGSKCYKKVKMLEQEGVFFSDEGVLRNKESMLWSVEDM